MGGDLYKVWRVEANGTRTLVRDDVSDPVLARALIEEGNRGAGIRNMSYRYALELCAGQAAMSNISTLDSAVSDSN